MKKFLTILASCVLFLAFLTGATACNDKDKNGAPVFRDKTLAGVGMSYDDETPTMEKFVTLNDIYFPEGIFDTRLGMWIYNASTDGWVRTNTEQGKALFDMNKPTFISTHGMGGGAFADMPELYADEYNVLAFHWGTYSGEPNALVATIADKVWLYEHYDKKGELVRGSRWQRVVFNNPEKTDWDWAEWEEEDVCNVSVLEIFCAFYYDLFKDLASYDSSSIHLFGHSYGGMVSIGAANLLITAYKCGLLPAYMLPDMVTLLDPFFVNCSSGIITWLGNDTPLGGNVCEVAYKTALDCQKLGITVRMHRSCKSVATPVTLGPGQNEFYWAFINNVVYSHLNNDAIKLFSGDDKLHNYGWDWFTSYYEGKMLTDAAAMKTTEQALCFAMDYDASFARTGIKYDVNLNGTKDSNDDILTSFYREYSVSGATDIQYKNSDTINSESLEQIATLTGKAKIAGFVYFDRNNNGKMDERVRDHLSDARVTVKNSAGETIFSGTTGINGYYEVEVSEEGNYSVSVELPYGYCLSTENASLQASVIIVDGLHQLALNNFGAKVA